MEKVADKEADSLNTSQISTGSSDESQADYTEEELKKLRNSRLKETNYSSVRNWKLYFSAIEGSFDKALDMYSEAIFCKVPKAKKAVYYSNRAFTNIKLENYAIALFGKSSLVKLTSSLSLQTPMKASVAIPATPRVTTEEGRPTSLWTS